MRKWWMAMGQSARLMVLIGTCLAVGAPARGQNLPYTPVASGLPGAGATLPAPGAIAPLTAPGVEAPPLPVEPMPVNPVPVTGQLPPAGAMPGPVPGGSPYPGMPPAPGAPGQFPWPSESGLPSAGPGLEGPPPGPYGPPPSAQTTPQCGLTGHLYMDVDWLYWYIRNRNLPVLFTTGDINNRFPGAIDQAGTQTLVGGNEHDIGYNGTRLTVDYWLGNRTLGAEVVFWNLYQKSSPYRLQSSGLDGTILVSRPFFNPNTNVNDADPVFIPNILGGSLQVSQPTEMWNTEINVKLNLTRPKSLWRIDFLCGARYTEFDEALNINEWLFNVPDIIGNPGDTFTISDSFAAHNRFYGFNLGTELELRKDWWWINLRAKCAIGTNHDTLNISGDTVVVDQNGTISHGTSQGLLVQPSNAGSFSHNSFGFIPEGGLNLGFHFCQHGSFLVGYTFMYWNSVIRPYQQIDTTVSIQPVPATTQIGAPRPIEVLKETSIWTQGLNLGLEFNY